MVPWPNYTTDSCLAPLNNDFILVAAFKPFGPGECSGILMPTFFISQAYNITSEQNHFDTAHPWWKKKNKEEIPSAIQVQKRKKPHKFLNQNCWQCCIAMWSAASQSSEWIHPGNPGAALGPLPGQLEIKVRCSSHFTWAAFWWIQYLLVNLTISIASPFSVHHLQSCSLLKAVFYW